MRILNVPHRIDRRSGPEPLPTPLALAALRYWSGCRPTGHTADGAFEAEVLGLLKFQPMLGMYFPTPVGVRQLEVMGLGTWTCDDCGDVMELGHPCSCDEGLLAEVLELAAMPDPNEDLWESYTDANDEPRGR